jgi:YidC/Oxa1 family membrane protein insertase
MDRKGIIVLIVSFVLLMLWFPLVNKLYPPISVSQDTNVVQVATNQAVSGPDTQTQLPAAPSSPPAEPGQMLVEPGTSEELLTLENNQIRLTLSSHGGGIRLVELKNHLESVSCSRQRSETNNLVELNSKAPLPLLTILGGPSIQGNGIFSCQRDNNSVRAEKVLSNGLRLVKEFQLSSNYLILATIRLENQGQSPLALPAQQWVAGTSTPINARDPGTYMGVYWYNRSKAQHVDESWFANRFMGCFPGTPRSTYIAGTDDVFWVAVHNQFFTLAMLPDQPAQQVIAVRTNLPPPSLDQIQMDSKVVRQPVGHLATLVYPGTNLAPGAVLERKFEIYAGPKEYNTLARLGAEKGNDLDLIMQYNGFFGFFAKILLLSMNGLHSLGLSYGLAIIAITIIIKLGFWPLTTASTRSMKRMATLQPQMKAIQERYKDDPTKMNRKLMEFMKEHKVSPLGGCLPMLLQIPVFFGFYRMILSATELRGARFLWACDLSQPDTLFVIPGTSIPFNLLPLLMGATMLWQARLTPPSPGMDPVQQKMMKYMPLMFLVILYNFSAGLTLYWTVQNLLTIAQMKLTKSKDAAAQVAAPAPAAKPVWSQPPKKTPRNKT